MRRFFVCFILAILSIPQVVLADDARARQQYESGLAAYRRGDYNRAIKEWQSAYKISKRPRFQHNIAEAYERLGEIAKAIAALERFLEIAESDDLSINDATALLASLKQRLSSTGILIRGAPKSASIAIDGKDWGFTPRPDKIPVKPGSHTVVVKKEGFGSFRSTVMVPAGRVAKVVAELEPETKTSRTQDTEGIETDQTTQYPLEPDNMDPEDGDNSATVLYVISGVLAAGAIGSTIWMADRIEGADQCSRPQAGVQCDNLDAINTEKYLAIATTAVVGTATLAVLVAAIWSDSSQSEESNQIARFSPLSLSGATYTIRF